MRRFVVALASAALLPLAGCHSHYIQTTITNRSGAPLSVVQVDYPSASFGIQTLANGASYQYRFKLLGSGNIKIGFTDSAHADHSVQGPWLNEGQEGTLEIVIPDSSHAEFHPSLRP